MTATGIGIVATGTAAISPAGVGNAPLREALLRGECLLRPVPGDLPGAAGYLWGRAECFRSGDYMSPLKARKFDRSSLFAVVAARMALEDAGVELSAVDASRVGIVIGSGFGGIANSSEFLGGFFRQGAGGLVPMLFPNTVPNASASNASIDLGIKGPNATFVQRFCSAEAAVQMACRFLEEDRADIVLTGGVDEITPLIIQGFAEAGQLGKFRPGFSEGAGILVLEREDHARRRNAVVKGRVTAVRSVGMLLAGREKEGLARLLGQSSGYGLVSMSGTARALPGIGALWPGSGRLETASVLGYSLAMGGVSLVSLLLMLDRNASAIHLAASPEGPFYAIDILGGAAV